MKNKKSSIIGVDVGGTKILLQTFDKKWNLIEEKKVFTEVKKGQAVFMKQLMGLIQEYFHPQIQSIGVAVPGIVERKTGILVKAPHLPVKNLKLKKLLSENFKRPVLIDNDINAFLYAQSQRPKLKKYRHLIGVMVGTGVGGAIMMNGQLMYGKQGFAGEVGHMAIKSEGKLLTLEQNTSGFFIPQIASQLGIKKTFIPVDLALPSPDSKKVKKYIVEHLGIGLSNLNLIFNPEAFVLDGSIYKRYLKESKSDLKSIILKRSMDGKVPLILDADQRHTAAMGAAMMSQAG